MTTENISAEKKINKQILSFILKYRHKKSSSSESENSYGDILSDKLLMSRVIRNGIPFSIFNSIRDITPLDRDEWAEFLDISYKTLLRYEKESKHFKSLQAEKILEIAEVTTVGLEVLGDMEKFKLWLSTPNYALGNYKPIELLKDSYGKELVVGELTRIQHGIFV